MKRAKVNSRKFIAVFTAVCMLITFMPMSVAAAETDGTETAANPPAFQDVAGHWGQTAIEKWSGYGIINGYNGMFRPDDSITRGEMAVILDNLMDYQVAAENKFSDLKAGQFYTEAILKANAAGIIKGDGATVRPLEKITREESAVMMSRAFAVAESGSAMSFGDASAVSAWAKGAVAGMEAKGYVSGYAGKFDPKANITRAAAVTMINNIVKAYYTKDGTYTDNVDGTAIIKVSDVILKGVTISGNLIIAEGVGKGDATLDNVTVKGETVVRGGGENSVHIIGSSSIASIRIEKIGDKLRIVVADGATVKEVEVAVGEEIVITGTVGTLEVNASDAVVYATAAEITTATVNGDNSTIVVGAQSTINSLVVSSTADNTAIKAETGSVVKSVEASATVAVTGTGTVSTVTLKAGADGSSVTTPKTVVPVATGVTGVTGTGGTVIPAGSSGTNGTSATAPATVGSSTQTGSTGGGGGNSSNTVPDPSVANVSNFDELKNAVSDSTIKIINLQNNIVVTEKLNILSEKHIDGKNYALNAIPVTGWDGFYILHFYQTTGSVKNIKLTGADAAMYVNGSTVELAGTVDVSGNEFGGIEVSKGAGVTASPMLTISTGAIVLNTSEANAIPTIWEDQIGTTESALRVTGFGGMKVDYNQKTDANIQRFYYLNNAYSAPYAVGDPSVANVSNFDELKNAVSDSTIKIINLQNNIVVTEKLNILSEKHIDGKNYALNATFTDGWTGFYILHFYQTTGSVKNIKLTGADAAMYVNGSTVELAGTVDVSGNEFGGIEVSKGAGVTASPMLTISTGAIVLNTSEANAIPTIWEDQIGTTESALRVTGSDGMKVDYNQKTDANIQRFYYLNSELSAPNKLAI